MHGETSSKTLARPLPITALAILNWLAAGCCAVGAVGFFAFAGRKLGLALGFGLPLLLIAALGVVAGWGLFKLHRTGRTVQIVLAALSLLLFPLGTILGALILVYMFTPGVVVLFSHRSETELSEEDLRHLRELRTPGGAVILAGVVALCLLGFVFFGGIIAAIAIPNLLKAADRARQARTLHDLRAIGNAVEEYLHDHEVCPQCDTIADLKKELEPDYIDAMPLADGWGHDLLYERIEGKCYRLLSRGKDGIRDAAVERDKGSFELDIVLEGGEFVQYPTGIDLPR